MYFASYPSNDCVNVRGSTGIPDTFVNQNHDKVFNRSSLDVVFEIFNGVFDRFCSFRSIINVEPEYSTVFTTPELVSIG